MKLRQASPCLAVCIILPFVIKAQAPGMLKGVVHDPQHHPLQDAQIDVNCQAAGWQRSTRSDVEGEFQIAAPPQGKCDVSVRAPSFRTQEQQITVGAKSSILHFQMELEQVRQSVEVSASRLDTQVSTVRSETSAREVEQTPGADQTNSLAMITDFVPGASMVHDMLHMRGGHQVNWFIDGVPVINTNIAANVAPLINPKNVDELETQRGGFSSEYGDRTYGFFNVLTPSGFDRDNQAELITSFGNFYSIDDQFNFGGHTQKLAYYASVDGNRSELGLGNPTSAVIHDQESGAGGFASLLFNATSKDQLRWTVSLREDHYQIPNTPEDQAAGIRDLDLERDYLIGFSWTHTLSEGLLFSVTPYLHYNSARYLGGTADTPFTLDDDDRHNYLGVRSLIQAQKKKHNARAGVEVWGQKDNTFFGLTANPGGQKLSQTERHWANSDAAFLEDQYKVNSWLTLDLGLRFTHYGGLVNENAFDPRLGGAIRIPRLNWVFTRLLRVLLSAASAQQLVRAASAVCSRPGLRFYSVERRARHSARFRSNYSVSRMVARCGQLPHER